MKAHQAPCSAAISHLPLKTYRDVSVTRPPTNLPRHVSDWELRLLCARCMVNKIFAGARYGRRGTAFTRAIPPCPKAKGAGGSISFTRDQRRFAPARRALRWDGGPSRSPTQPRCGPRQRQRLEQENKKAVSMLRRVVAPGTRRLRSCLTTKRNIGSLVETIFNGRTAGQRCAIRQRPL